MHDYFWKDLYVHLVKNPVIVKFLNQGILRACYNRKHPLYPPPSPKSSLSNPGAEEEKYKWGEGGKIGTRQ